MRRDPKVSGTFYDFFRDGKTDVGVFGDSGIVI
jgi:hypothetical protein